MHSSTGFRVLLDDLFLALDDVAEELYYFGLLEVTALGVGFLEEDQDDVDDDAFHLDAL